jgi:asparagine synthase (glutamine-hydrolysing)
MCGIAGIATRGMAPARELVMAMCEVIRHRGPDGAGVFVAPGVGIGMRRLAVLDLATGDQPVSNHSKTVHAVFNGEIYNYLELRRELVEKGYSLRGTGDSEVIPHLYEEYGPAFVSRLNGMFAIALWDSRQRQLLLCRDRMGIKPLFYSLHHGNLYFGSEVKCILAGGGSDRRMDPHGIDQLLTFEFTAAPTTLFTDVHKLPPGSCLTWSEEPAASGRFSHRVTRFWSLDDPVEPLQAPVEEIAERLRHAVTEAVRRQLASDVPLGAFLSGGIDSSIMVAAMCETSPRTPLTFSVGFGDASYNELHYARQVAEYCGTRHHEEILTPDFLSLLPEVVGQLDQPIADFSIFPTLLVSRMARAHVTVALGGDGADELFAGYDTYEAERYAAKTLNWMPLAMRANIERAARLLPLNSDKRGFGNQVRRFLEGASLPAQWQHMRWMVAQRETDRGHLYRDAFRAEVAGGPHGGAGGAFAVIEEALGSGSIDPLGDQMRCDLKLYLADNILTKIDAMSMLDSLEARVPYLDNEVVALALAIPSRLKLKGGVRKWILKKAFAGRLPESILQRGKEGFSMPMKNWLQGEWNALMHELLCAENLARDGLFDARYVDRLMREHESHARNNSHILWALMVFQLWRDRFATPAVPPQERVHAA